MKGKTAAAGPTAQALKLILAAALAATGIGLFFGLQPDAAPRWRWYLDLNTNELFAAAATEIPPIDAPSGPLRPHGAASEPAGVLAMVFRLGRNAGPRIAFIQKRTPESRALAERQARGEELTPAEAGALDRGVLVAEPPERPGQAIAWFGIDSPQGAWITRRMGELRERDGHAITLPDDD